MNKTKKSFIIAIALWLAFVLFTVLVQVVDVQAIGPMGSEVGFASLNQWMQQTLGSHDIMDTLTDGTLLIALAAAGATALLALVQWIKRKSLLNIDRSLFWLAGCYLLMVAMYIIFEESIVNYRPILEEGVLEASYPSSHTMLVFFMLGTAMIQWKDRLPQKWSLAARVLAAVVIAVTVVGRAMAGVHWFTDIVGGVLLGAALVSLYYSLHHLKKQEV